MAQRNSESNNEIIGTWKFSCQSAINDFQKIFNQKGDFRTEYFTFSSNHTFIHEFADKDEHLIKTLTGKWKFSGSKIKIDYAEVDYTLLLEYFFIDKYLVLGQNFNHVIFTRYTADSPFSMLGVSGNKNQESVSSVL
jgi:hypothetical protein